KLAHSHGELMTIIKLLFIGYCITLACLVASHCPRVRRQQLSSAAHLLSGCFVSEFISGAKLNDAVIKFPSMIMPPKRTTSLVVLIGVMSRFFGTIATRNQTGALMMRRIPGLISFGGGGACFLALFHISALIGAARVKNSDLIIYRELSEIVVSNIGSI